MVVCSDGHSSAKVATLGYDVSREWIDDPSFLVVHQSPSGRVMVAASARLFDERRRTFIDKFRLREDVPGVGTKIRLRCGQCGNWDVPVSWDTLDRLVPTLRADDVRRIELFELAAKLKGNSRKAGSP